MPRRSSKTLAVGTMAAILLGAYPARQPAAWAAPPSTRVPGPAPVVPVVDKNRTFVTHLFQDLLARAPDPGSLSYWATQLAGGTPRQTIVQSLLGSDEYETAEVAALYGLLLHRPPDAAGSLFWIRALSSGQTLEQVEAQIAGSEEYYRNAGASGPAFVARVFSDVLGRPADAASIAFYAGALARGTTRVTLAQTLLGSNEYASKVVAADFAKYLHRPPTAQDVQAMTPLLQQSGGSRSLLVAILSSTEYFDRA